MNVAWHSYGEREAEGRGGEGRPYCTHSEGHVEGIRQGEVDKPHAVTNLKLVTKSLFIISTPF